jgi:hypothetical protein
MFFIFPIGDDLGNANRAQFMFDIPSAVVSVIGGYWNWSGRVTHLFLVVFLGDAAKSRIAYGLVVLSVPCVYWVSLFGIFNELQGQRNRGTSLFLATSCLLAFLAMHPNLRMLFTTSHTLGLAIGNGFVLTFIWSLCRLWNKTNFSKSMKLFVFGSGIAALGSYEHATIMALLVVVAAYFIAKYCEHPNLRSFQLTAVVIGICCLASFCAPGNFGRNRARHVSFAQMFENLRMALPVWKIHTANALMSPFLLVALLLGIVIPPRIRLLVQKRFLIPHVVTGGVILFVCVSLGIVLLHALSDQPLGILPDKFTASLVILSNYVLVTMSIMLGCYVAEYTKNIPLLLPGGLLMFYCITTDNYRNTVHSLVSGAGSAYAATWERRHAFIHQNQGKDLAVSSLLLYPFLMNVYGDAVPASKDHWFGNYAPEFFHVKSILSVLPYKDNAVAQLGEHVEQYPHVTQVIGSDTNVTFRHSWIALSEPNTPDKMYYTRLFFEDTSPDFLPDFLRVRLNSELEKREVLESFSWPMFLGIGVRSRLEDWQVTGAGKTTHLLPLAAEEWGRLKAVYGSFDGKTFTRIYLADL